MSNELVYFRLPNALDFSLKGEDAYAFIQSQGTQDIESESGMVSHTLFLDHKGKLHGDAYVLTIDEETIRLLSLAPDREALLNKLDRHIIADDVELIQPEEDSYVYCLGGDWSAYLSTLVSKIPDEGTYIAENSLFLWKAAVVHEDGYLLISSTELDLSKIGHELDKASYEFMRIERSSVSIPHDLGNESTPLEGPLKSSVSFDKGCYLGQEVVNRLFRLERSNKQLFKFKTEAEELSSGVSVFSGDREIGKVTTVAPVPSGGSIGYALIQVKHFSDDAAISGVKTEWTILSFSDG